MGKTGIILKSKDDVDIYKMLDDIKIAAEQAGLEPRIESRLRQSFLEGGVYTTANIADTYEDIPEAQQFLMYIHSDDDCYDQFDWIHKGENLMRSIFIECFRDSEKILLDFLYHYLTLNPHDYFWDEYEWYYSYEDIVMIKQMTFDPDWCYKNPHSSL